MQTYELTSIQSLMLTAQQFYPEAPLYNMAMTFRIKSVINRQRFHKAFAHLVAQHDVLRTLIETDQDKPIAVIRPDVSPALLDFDLSGQPDKESRLDALLDRLSCECFELKENTYRSALIRIADNEWIWFFCQHHVLSDITSFKLLFERLGEIYHAEPENLETPPQFRDYAQNQHQVIHKSKLRQVEQYWQKKTQNDVEKISLFQHEPSKPATSAARKSIVLDDYSSNLIEKFNTARKSFPGRQTDEFVIFAAGTLALLYRLTGNEVIRLGLPMHNRPSPRSRNTAGAFIEIGVMEITVKPDDDLATLVDKTRLELMECMQHSLSGCSSAAINRSFDVLINYLPLEFGTFGELPCTTDWLHTGHVDPQHQLRIQVHDLNASGLLQVDLDASTAMFNDQQHTSVLKYLEGLLRNWLERPELAVSSVGYFDANTVLPAVTKTKKCSANILELITTQTQKIPNEIALQCGDTTITYSELDRRSEDIARALEHQAGRKLQLIPILAERSVNTICGILGILKTGAAFVPIEPALPEGRVTEILEQIKSYDNGQLICIVSNSTDGRLQANCVKTINLDHLDFRKTRESGIQTDNIFPTQLAYVMFTSGSTGKPKGVMVSHQALADYVEWAASEYVTGEKLSFPLFSSLGFDLTITSLFLPLVTGGRMIIYPAEHTELDTSILDVFSDNQCDFVKLTPSHLELVPDQLLQRSRVTRMVVGGEDFKTTQANRVAKLSPHPIKIYNEYGPTEATVACMIHPFNTNLDTGTSIPIGLAIADAEIYVLDQRLQPVPVEIRGEICIGGRGLAEGYLGDAATTEEKFCANPFQEGKKLYRTGDIGVWRKDGLLEYRGRIDNQLKINGIRVEAAEIEATITGYPHVDAAVVMLIETKSNTGFSSPTHHCKRCGMPDNYPQTWFDEFGVCSHCRQYENRANEVNRFFKNQSELERLCKSIKSKDKSTPDCLALYSGGKDSTYMLYQLVELGLNPLVFTLDNSYLSEQAKKNIHSVTKHLTLHHEYAKTEHMAEIFADSLTRFSNVCNGCFKTVYTLSMFRAKELGLKTIFTGLSRGQLFETRLDDLYDNKNIPIEAYDNLVQAARKTYHCIDDAVTRHLGPVTGEVDSLLSNIAFVDFYRYIDVPLSEVYGYLDKHTRWIRPRDTGRSTNCLINDVGIFVHKHERGYHNYALPYSWDVRLGHKDRYTAMQELDDEIDQQGVNDILREIGYQPEQKQKPQSVLTAFVTKDPSANNPVDEQDLREHLNTRLPHNIVPKRIIFLDNLPLNTHGKTDLAALHKLADREKTNDLRVSDNKPPVTREEKLLVEIWQRELGLTDISIDNDFFGLGGDSMNAIQIWSAITKKGYHCEPQWLFERPTVESLANAIRLKQTSDAKTPSNSENQVSGEPIIDIAISETELQDIATDLSTI